MAIIKVETPDGIVDVEIEGEEPNQEEQQAIMNTFFSEGGVEAINQEAGKINFATASPEELQEYIKSREALGVDAVTGEPIEVDPTKEKGVDYVSGLRDFRIRAGFSNKEKDSEKAAYLKDQVGKDGFRQDKKGRFILTKKGRERLGMPDGPELAIDEEGLSRYDVADFIGQAGVPLAIGIGASIATGGMGTWAAMGIVGGSMGIGKLLDEAFESAQGYQRQSAAEITKDVAVEAVFGAAGEGLGRAISYGFGRIFKGSASRQAEEAKAGGREMLEKNFRPSVEGAAPGTFGILTRLQAIYEGIAPNQVAAEKNVKALMEELKRVSKAELGNVTDESIENLGKVIKKDIEKLYADSETLLKNAKNIQNNQIEKEVSKLINPLKKGQNIGIEEAKGLLEAKDLFARAMDDLYAKVDTLMGKGQEIVPIGDLKRAIDADLIWANEKTVKAVQDSKIMQILDKAERRAIERLKSKAGTMEVNAQGTARPRWENPDEIRREMFVTAQEGNIIRSALTDLDYSGIPGVNFGSMRKAIDQGFTDALGLMDKTIRFLEKTAQKPLSPNMLARLGEERFLGRFGKNVEPADLRNLRDGLDLLAKTQKQYASGIRRINDPIVRNLINATQKGKYKTDNQVMAHIVKANRPEELRRLFLGRKGIPVNLLRELGLDQKPVMVRYAGNEYTIDEAFRLYEIDPNLKGSKVLKKAINEAEKKKALRDKELKKTRPVSPWEEDEFLGGAGFQGEQLRQRLASAWIKELLDSKKSRSTVKGKRVYDGIKIANAIDDLGETKAVLFGKDLKKVDELTALLRSTGKDIDEEVIDAFASSPLSQAIRGVKEASEQIDAINKDTYLTALRTKDASKIVDTIFTKKDSSMIKAFMNNNIEAQVPGQDRVIKVAPFKDTKNPWSPVDELTEHEQLVEQVQNAAMGKILKSLGDVEDAGFRDAFLSGSLGTELKGTLKGYGKESLEAMFGKEQTNDLYKLADLMTRASDKPLKGKGGLAAPSIALGLSIFGLMTAPVATIGAIAFYNIMSRALRRPEVMHVLLSSRQPGEDAIGQALQTMNTISAQMGMQTGVRPIIEETQRVAASIPTAFPQQEQEQTGTPVPNVSPPFGNTATARIDPTNPIVNPDPQSQALAQAMASRGLYR